MRRIVRWGLFTHPFVLPAAVLWCTASLVVWLVVGARRARAGEPPPSVWPLLFAFAAGVLLAVTLTPSRIGLGLEFDHRQPVWCLPQWPRTGFGLWSASRERRWNVLLAIPLGLAAAGWAARHWRGGPVERGGRGGRGGRGLVAAIPVAAALGLPWAVELAQALLPRLGRVCAVVDAADNASGVLIGLAAGTLAAAIGAVHGSTRSRPRRA